MLLFYIIAAFQIYLSLLSLRGGIRFRSYIREEIAQTPPDYAPPVAIIAPCRGLDEGLEQNLKSLLSQHYPKFEVIFSVDSSSDPAVDVINQVRCAHSEVATRLIVAGKTRSTGQKVHNLIEAVGTVDPDKRVFVFADSDGRPAHDWLRSLVGPLSDSSLGAATGYRWFVGNKGFSSFLKSTWNASIASALGCDEWRNFCWGGATAIRRSTFERLRVRELWEGVVSDDFVLTSALHSSGLRIHFVPAALTPSSGKTSFRELLEFTNRQLRITRVYAPKLWLAALLGNTLFAVTFLLSLFFSVVEALRIGVFQLPLFIAIALFILGALKSLIRARAVAKVLKQSSDAWKGTILHMLLWPLASCLFALNSVVACFSRKISWRGITYYLKSPTETEIL